jgi:hypothetical protein
MSRAKTLDARHYLPYSNTTDTAPKMEHEGENMQIEVAVSIDARQPVEQAVSQCWEQMFKRPNYSSEKGGPGWEAVRHQVVRYIDGLDLTSEIHRAAQARLPALVDDVVSAALSAAIKKRAKALQSAAQPIASDCGG